jgi:membrane protease YdiL (CAAX protease family)
MTRGRTTPPSARPEAAPTTFTADGRPVVHGAIDTRQSVEARRAEPRVIEIDSHGLRENSEFSRSSSEGLRENSEFSRSIPEGLRENSEFSTSTSEGLRENSEFSKSTSEGLQENSEFPRVVFSQPAEPGAEEGRGTGRPRGATLGRNARPRPAARSLARRTARAYHAAAMSAAPTNARGALREVGLVYAAVSVATVLVTRLRDTPGIGEYVHLAVGALFLVPAIKLAEREPGGLRRYGIDLAGLLAPPDDRHDAPAEPAPADVTASDSTSSHAAASPASAPAPDATPRRRASFVGELIETLRTAAPSALRETLVALAVLGVVFPPFALGFHFWHGPTRAFALHWPPDLASFALAQVVVVALPEEAFFRGFVQTRLTDAWPRTVRLLGAQVSPGALLVQAALFGALHFAVDLAPERLAVAFPALLFGWLRARRGGIGAAILVHAASNVYADILVRGWL